ncbi:MAG: hypothetical protein KKB70_02540 [Proteobacteria bacterium]|nr:hypothetical protein [Pseudomonadota bacterium]
MNKDSDHFIFPFAKIYDFSEEWFCIAREQLSPQIKDAYAELLGEGVKVKVTNYRPILRKAPQHYKPFNKREEFYREGVLARFYGPDFDLAHLDLSYSSPDWTSGVLLLTAPKPKYVVWEDDADFADWALTALVFPFEAESD